MQEIATWVLRWLPSSATLTAIFGGAGVVLIWELLLKPRRERQNVARTIAAEVLVNLKLMYARRAQQRMRPNEIPRSSALSRVAVDAVGEKLGELPPDLLEKVIELSAHVDLLNRLVLLHSEVVQRREEHRRDSPAWSRLLQRSLIASDAFKAALDRTIELGATTLLMLHAVGKPSRTRLTRDRLLALEKEIEREALENQAARQRRLKEIGAG